MAAAPEPAVVRERTVRIFPKVVPYRGWDVVSCQWKDDNHVVWYAQELTLEGEHKAVKWRAVGESSTRDALLAKLKGVGFTEENAVFTFSTGVPE